jgi:hypothetical protein
MIDEVMPLIQRFIRANHPGADAVLLAGSTARGCATSLSDLDLVVLFDCLPEGAWRETRRFEGRLIEGFFHDLATLEYFCRNIDAPSGVPVMPTMIVEAIILQEFPAKLAAAAKTMAQDVLDAGPVPWTQEELDLHRYMISDLADDLRVSRSFHEMMAVGIALYPLMATFLLRASGRWSAKGKAAIHALAAHEPRMALRFERDFGALFSNGRRQQVLGLINDILAPHGGRLLEGFTRQAPPDWRHKP